MSSSSLLQGQIPLDHTQKQLLFPQLASAATTVSWSPPSSTIHGNLLAVGHSQGLSIYRQVDEPPESESTLNDRAEAFRKR